VVRVEGVGVSQSGVWEVDERVELQAGGLDSTTEQRVPSSFPRASVVRSPNDANP
jgi:hypothetical protein